MKILIEIDSPGFDQVHTEPSIESQIDGYVRALVKSLTRDERPKVVVAVAPDSSVLVDADALLRLQERLGIK